LLSKLGELSEFSVACKSKTVRIQLILQSLFVQTENNAIIPEKLKLSRAKRRNRMIRKKINFPQNIVIGTPITSQPQPMFVLHMHFLDWTHVHCRLFISHLV
jgi:hypothetical protein